VTLLVQPTSAGEHPLAAEVRRVVVAAAAGAPRSRQRVLGPSEYGVVCARRLAYRIFEFDHLNRPDGWYASIGTATHSWLSSAFDADGDRWVTDVRVTHPVAGSLDLFDLATNTVVDFKVVGPTALATYRRNGPGSQYRTQVHLYGDGMRHKGAVVDHVAVAFLGRNSALEDAYVWSEPYDPQVGERARARVATLVDLGVALHLDVPGRDRETAVRQVATADSYCHYCPWFSRTDARGCPGHDTEGK
jgi:hypothetical protein